MGMGSDKNIEESAQKIKIHLENIIKSMLSCRNQDLKVISRSDQI